SDGSAWTHRTAGNRTSFGDVVSDGTRYVAVGFASVMTSPDAVNWTTVNPFFDRWLLGVATNGSLFVAVGDQNAIFTSPDGAAWTRRTAVESVVLHDVIWDGSRFVVVGSDGAVRTSSDGIAWTEAARSGNVLKSLAWNGTQYVAAGGGRSPVLHTSTGLSSPTPRPSPGGRALDDRLRHP